MHNISWFPFNFLDTFVEELFEVYNSVKLSAIYQHRLRIEFGLWLLLLSVAPSCSKEHFAPIYFVKGQHMAIYAHICTTYHFVGHKLYSRINMSYTQCICKRSVRRLHQAIISFSGISVNDRLTKIWLRKADGGIHFHCQIGISPHRRVLNEQTQLMSESKPAFRRAVKWQTGSREEGKARSNVRNAVHLYAPTSLPVTHRQCPFLSTVLNISSKGSWEHGSNAGLRHQYTVK